MKNIKVLTYRVGEEPKIGIIDNSLETFQGIVGGNIEVAGIGNNVFIVCNEEGKIEGLPFNRVVKPIHDLIAGDFFVAKEGDDGNFTDLTDEDILYAKENII